MKTCPVCSMKVFDDMDYCYGCMHSFKEEPPAFSDSLPRVSFLDEGRFADSKLKAARHSSYASEALSSRSSRVHPVSEELALQSVRQQATTVERARPVSGKSTMTLRLELKQGHEPVQVWCAELKPEPV